MVIVKDKKKYSDGGCNMLHGLGFLIVIHGREKCKYFPIFLWTVLLAIFILQHLRILWYQDCLPPWASCSSYHNSYHALETVLMENKFFIRKSFWLDNYSAINRPKILVHHDSGHGVLWIIQWIFGRNGHILYYKLWPWYVWCLALFLIEGSES